MSFLAKIAFKNLFRHKLRTFVSNIAIAFGVMIVIFARGYVVGMIDSVFADHIQYNSGHIKIIDREYQQLERVLPLNYPVDGLENQSLDEMIASLNEINKVEMVIPRLKYGAMVSTGEELISMTGWGVNPDQEIQFTNIEKNLVEGRMVLNGQREVVMGTSLLNKLGYKVGDKITILSNTAFNSLNGVTFEIVGRIESGIKILDEIVFYLPLDQAQSILYMENQVTELLLVTENRNLVEQVLPVVNEMFSENGVADRYLALSYRETSDLLPFMELGKMIYNQVYVFLVLLSSIVVINTMIMMVKERTREIGMMSALGMNGRDILKLFIIEGGIMGLTGSFIGALFGSIIVDYLSVTGIDFSAALSGFSSEVIFNSYVYPVSSIGNTIFAFVLGTIIVTIACIIPARRAVKLEPTEAMREG